MLVFRQQKPNKVLVLKFFFQNLFENFVFFELFLNFLKIENGANLGCRQHFIEHFSWLILTAKRYLEWKAIGKYS